MSFLPFYRGESICTADLDLIHERITKEDLADHGITVAILNDLNWTAYRLKELVGELQPKCLKKYEPSKYTKPIIQLTLTLRLKHCIREFREAKCGSITFTADHVWVVCRELVMKYGHVYFDVFAPRWPRHASMARAKVEEIFQLVHPEARLNSEALAVIVARVWRVFLQDPVSLLRISGNLPSGSLACQCVRYAETSMR